MRMEDRERDIRTESEIPVFVFARTKSGVVSAVTKNTTQ